MTEENLNPEDLNHSRPNSDKLRNSHPTGIAEVQVLDGEGEVLFDDELAAVGVDVEIVLLPGHLQVEVPVPQNGAVHPEVVKHL